MDAVAMYRVLSLLAMSVIGTLVGVGCAESRDPGGRPPGDSTGARPDESVNTVPLQTADGGVPDGGLAGPNELCSSAPVTIVDGCPFPACSCPANCMPVDGHVFDKRNECSTLMTIGCVPPGGLSTDGPCFKRTTDGLIVHASSTGMSQGGDEWVSCSAEETQSVSWASCER
jgi:hypothetical protein